MFFLKGEKGHPTRPFYTPSRVRSWILLWRRRFRARSFTVAAICAVILTIMTVFNRGPLSRTQRLTDVVVSGFDRYGWEELSKSDWGTVPSTDTLRIASFIRIWVTHEWGGMPQVAYDRWRYGVQYKSWEVHVFTTSHPDKGDYELYDGIHVHYLPTPSKVYTMEYYQTAARKLRQMHEEQKFDLIHMDSRAVREIDLQSFRDEIPLGLTWHGNNYDNLRSQLSLRIFDGERPDSGSGKDPADLKSSHPPLEQLYTELKYMYYGALRYRYMEDYHVTVQPAAAADLLKIFKVRRSRIFPIVNGIDLSFYQKGTAAFANQLPRADVRKELNIPEDAFVIGYTGRAAEEKGVQTLIAALPKILDNKPNVYVVTIGDGALAPDLRDAHARFRPNMLHLGPMHHDQLPQLYGAFDLQIDPAIHYSGFNTVISEAQCAGTMVLVSDAERLTSTFDPLDKGDETWVHFFSMGDAEDLARKANHIIDTMGQNGAREYGQRAKKYWCEQYGLEASVDRYDKLFRSVVSAKRAGKLHRLE